MIVVFSGTDGSGKSTQIEMLINEFRNQGFRTKYIWARGGYTPLFSVLKKILRMLTAKKILSHTTTVPSQLIIRTYKPWTC